MNGKEEEKEKKNEIKERERKFAQNIIDSTYL